MKAKLSMFINIFQLNFRVYIKDWSRFRYKLILNVLLAVNILFVSIIYDQTKLSELTGIQSPIVFILIAFLISALLNATFHMPRAFAEGDIISGRFEYIMTTKSFKHNYFWYYVLSLLIIEIINLSPVIIGFIVILCVTLKGIVVVFTVGKIFLIILSLIIAFVLTMLISTINLYSALASRKYKLNSSLILVGLVSLAGTQFPFHAFGLGIRITALFNPITAVMELWRYCVLPNYIPFISFPYLIVACVIHLVVLFLLAIVLLKKMNKKIRINGAGKLLE